MTDLFNNRYRIKSARLTNWDYHSDAAYFITICTAGKQHYFGEIISGGIKCHGIVIETPCMASLPCPTSQPCPSPPPCSTSQPCPSPKSCTDDIVKTPCMASLPYPTPHPCPSPQPCKLSQPCRMSQPRMQLSPLGEIVESEWLKTPDLRPDMNLSLGNFVVMPDHFHAIIIIGPNDHNREYNKPVNGPQRKKSWINNTWI